MKYIYRIFIIISVLLLLFGLTLCFLFVPRTSKVHKNIIQEVSGKEEEPSKISIFNENNDPVHILMLGLDKTATTYEKDADSMRSDTIMLLTIDPAKNKVQLISIPRDTYYKIPGYDNYKINAAYSRGGLKLALKTIGQFMNTKIDHYVTVDYEAVKELVDAVGGIEVHTPTYHYEDPSTIPPLVIDFQEGDHLLNGEDTVKYLRIRKIYENQDIDRIHVQQNFLMKIFDKMKSPSMLFRVPKLISIANNYVDSDLSYGQLSYLAYYGLTLDKNDIQMVTLPGDGFRKNHQDYYRVSPERARKILRDFEKWIPDESKLTQEEREKLEAARQKRQELQEESITNSEHHEEKSNKKHSSSSSKSSHSSKKNSSHEKQE